VLKELHFIDQNAGGSILMDNPELSSEARERYLISSLMEEAIASSQIARIILKSVRQYGRAYLYAEHEDRDATYFLVYHLKAIHLALEELHNYLARKQKEMQKATTLLRKIPDLNYRQLALLQHALKRPDAAYTIESHKNSHNIVRAAARADLFDLVEREYLGRGKQGRRYYFRAVSDIAEKLN
jgi:Fic family protein